MSGTRIPVIFDTDPGIDDAMALFLLARHPGIALQAITTVFGNADVQTTTRNALALSTLMGLDVPVAAGAAGPLLPRASAWFPTHVHGEDGLGGQVGLLPRAKREALAQPAHELICQRVNAAPGEVTLLAVGPLTNLALALRHDPGIAERVKQVVIMGGAFGMHGHQGNVSPVAEANIANDPEAADLVLNAAWPVVLVGLDVTQQVILSQADLAGLRGRGNGVGDFLWAITRHYEGFYDGRDGIAGIYAHDVSAAVHLVAAEAFKHRQGPIRVVTDGLARGQTIQDHQGLAGPDSPWALSPRQQVCVDVDAARLRAEFLGLF